MTSTWLGSAAWPTTQTPPLEWPRTAPPLWHPWLSGWASTYCGRLSTRRWAGGWWALVVQPLCSRHCSAAGMHSRHRKPAGMAYTWAPSRAASRVSRPTASLPAPPMCLRCSWPISSTSGWRARALHRGGGCCQAPWRPKLWQTGASWCCTCAATATPPSRVSSCVHGTV